MQSNQWRSKNEQNKRREILAFRVLFATSLMTRSDEVRSDQALHSSAYTGKVKSEGGHNCEGISIKIAISLDVLRIVKQAFPWV